MSLSDRLLDLTGLVPRKGSRVERARAATGIGRSAEWRRINALPRRVLDLDKVVDLSPVWRIDDHDCPGCDLCASGRAALRPIQSAMLWEAEGGGLAAFAGVGHGKELTCLLLPEAMDLRRAVIVTKPRLKTQMLEDDIPRYGRHFRLPLERVRAIVSYAELQVSVVGVGRLPKVWKWLAYMAAAISPSLLEQLNPDGIIFNESQALKNRSSARTWRVMRFHADNPGCKAAILTGSPSNRYIKEYAYLIAWALGRRTPVPDGWRELDDWDRALSEPEKREDKYPVAPGALLDLCGADALMAEIEALSVEDKTKFYLTADDSVAQMEVARGLAQRIYQRRLSETPGVVVTGAGSVDIPLTIAARRIEVPDVVVEALAKLRRTWSIDGEELREAKDLNRYARQLSCGFYYRWAWPGGEKDHDWLEARAEWRKAVRDVLRHRRRPGMDSALQVARAAERGDLAAGAVALAAWPRWAAVRGRWKPKPPTEAVWLDDFVVRDCLRFAEECSEEEPGIVWYDHDALGEALATAGMKVYGPGKQGDGITRSREACVAASRHAHSDGKNLQWFRKFLTTTPPANGIAWEQALGRGHRPGQRAEEVEVEVYTHDQSLRGAIAQALKDARTQERREGMQQKLLQARRIGIDFESGDDDDDFDDVKY